MPKAKQPKPSKTLAEQYAELQKKYLITKRALELACEDFQFFDYGKETKDEYNYYMGKAKRELNNEEV